MLLVVALGVESEQTSTRRIGVLAAAYSARRASKWNKLTLYSTYYLIRELYLFDDDITGQASSRGLMAHR